MFMFPRRMLEGLPSDGPADPTEHRRRPLTDWALRAPTALGDGWPLEQGAGG